MKKLISLLLGFISCLIIAPAKAERFSGVVNPFNVFPYYGMRYASWRRTYPWKYRRHYWPYFPYDGKSLWKRRTASQRQKRATPHSWRH